MGQSSLSNELKFGSTPVNREGESLTEAHRSQIYSLGINSPLNYVIPTGRDLMSTQLVGKDGKPLGTALDLVKSVETIAGDEKGKGSDEKFRVYVTLNDNAISILKQARGVEVGKNRVYHGEYKLSFRQERTDGVKGLEAGFQISATEDGRLGDVDVDYRHGISHIRANNSNVQAKGNCGKHNDRWPGLPYCSNTKARER
jgi:hypothetical protein